jgi:hypothetical protein
MPCDSGMLQQDMTNVHVQAPHANEELD